MCCTSIVYATDRKHTKVEFPEARIFEDTLNILLYEGRGDNAFDNELFRVTKNVNKSQLHSNNEESDDNMGGSGGGGGGGSGSGGGGGGSGVRRHRVLGNEGWWSAMISMQ